MSKVSTIIDAVDTRLDSLFSASKIKIPNPYSLEDNNEMFLREGYGFKIGTASVEASEFCNYAYSLNFIVVITKEVLKLDSDNAVYKTASKALLEDLKTLQDNMLGYSQLNQGDSIELIRFEGSDGIEFIKNDKSNFIFLEASFSFVIRENL